MVGHHVHLYNLIERLVVSSLTTAPSSASLGIVRGYLGYFGAALVLRFTHHVPLPTDPG